MIPIFRVANMCKIFRSIIRTHHTGQTSPTLRDGSCSRNLKNYFSNVTFDQFYPDSRKLPRIKADVFPDRHLAALWRQRAATQRHVVSPES